MKKLLGLLFIVLSFAVNAQVNPAFNSVRLTGSDSTGYTKPDGWLFYNPTSDRYRGRLNGSDITFFTSGNSFSSIEVGGTAAGTDTYTVTVNSLLAAYSSSVYYRITFTNANTVTNPTLNINSIGAKSIIDNAGSALSIGDLKAGGTYDLVYDGTDLRVMNLGGGGGGGSGWPLTGSASLTGNVAVDGNYNVKLGLGTPFAVFQVDALAGVDLLGFNGNAALQMQDGAWSTFENVSITSLAAQTFIYRLTVDGTPVAGFGMYHDYTLENGGNNLASAHTKVVTWTDVTDAAETSKVELTTKLAGSVVTPITMTGLGVGIFTGSPTARLHLPAGTATANTAPLKLTTGTALTTPEDGAIEYHGSHLYFTIGSTRYQIDQQAGGSGWAVTGTTTLTGGVTIAQAGNDILFHNGNILFGPTSSTITSNTKVDIRGTGTGTNKAFRVADSGDTQRLQILDNGRATFYSSSMLGGGTDQIFHFDQVNTTGNPTNGAFMRLSPDVRTSVGTSSNWMTLDLDGFYYHGGAATQSATSLRIKESLSSWVAAYNAIKFETSHNISGGTGTHANLNIVPTYNFTSTYSGNVYGLLYNPTLTSMTGVTHIAAAFASGDVVIGSSTPTTSAALDVQSTTKAFIPPRMTETQRDAITSPSAGMIIYNTTTNVLNFYNGSSWGAI